MKSTFMDIFKICLLPLSLYLSLRMYGQGNNDIRTFLNVGKNDSARTIIEDKIKENKNLSELYFLYSLSFIEHVDTTNNTININNYDSTGLAFLDKSLEIDPNNIEALLKRGIINSGKFKYLESKQDFIKIRNSEKPYPWEADFYLAIAEANLGSDPKNKLTAIEILQMSNPESDHDKFRMHRLKGMYYSDLLDHSASILAYSSALKLAPNNYNLLELRGDEKFASGNTYGAISDLRRAYELSKRSPNGDKSYKNRFAYRLNMKMGRILMDSNRLAESIECYEKSIRSLKVLDDLYDVSYWQNEIDQNLAESYLYKGDCYYLLGNVVIACSMWNQANNFGIKLHQSRIDPCK